MLNDPSSTPVGVITAKEDPELLVIFAHILLYRLGGQQSFTLDEMTAISKECLGMRTIYDIQNETFLLTLKPVVKNEGAG
jgi:hypothetical protein